jgi:hypothetical protein
MDCTSARFENLDNLEIAWIIWMTTFLKTNLNRIMWKIPRFDSDSMGYEWR